MSPGPQTADDVVISKFDMHDEYIRHLCEHVIELRLVHPAMLYAVGLTTIWKHVGHHPVFKENEGNGNTIILPLFAYVTWLSDAQILEKTDHHRVVEYENERVLAAKRKAQAAKDRVAVKRSDAEGTSRHTKKKKAAPITFALDDSEEDDSTRTGVHAGKGTALLYNEVIPQHSTPLAPMPKFSRRLTTIGSLTKRKAQAAKDRVAVKRSDAEGTSRHTKKKKAAPITFALDDSEEDDSTRTGSGKHHFASLLNTIISDDANLTTGRSGVASESVRYEEGDVDHVLENAEEGIEAESPPATHHLGSQRSHRSKADTHTHFIELRHDVGDKQDHQHASGHVVSSSSGGSARLAFPKRNPGGDGTGLVDKLAVMEKENDDLLDKNRKQEERIKRLEEELPSKSSSLIEAKGSVSELKGDLERLTVDLSQAEIVRHNYVRQLLPTAFQRLLSSYEYKKSLSDVFNQAIAARWSEGVKIERTQEEAEAILATAADYDPSCKDTFMSAFDSLFTRSYPYVEKLTESFRMPLGDLQNIAWTHPGRLRSGKYSSLYHWYLDSSGASCVSKNVNHLAISTWTHPERLALWETCVSDQILRTQSCEFRRVSSLRLVLVSLSEDSPETLSKISSGGPFGCPVATKLQESVNLTQELFKLTNNVICQMVMGMRCYGTKSEADEAKNLVREVTKLFGEFNVSDFIWFCKNIDFKGFKTRYTGTHKRYDALLEKIISEREIKRRETLKEESLRRDCLDIMLDILEDEKAEIKITRNHIKALILDFFVAGTDSTATAIEWTLAELIKNPHVLKEAQREIDQAIGDDRLVEEPDSPKLPYMHAIIKESLRLHPPIPMVNRESTENVTIHGYDIPAGTMIFVNTWSIGKNPEYWENPLEFNPRRFLEGSTIDGIGQNYQFLPFGTGSK
nr:flavone synthase II [Tanacetum cinerariifolium]